VGDAVALEESGIRGNGATREEEALVEDGAEVRLVTPI